MGELTGGKGDDLVPNVGEVTDALAINGDLIAGKGVDSEREGCASGGEYCATLGVGGLSGIGELSSSSTGTV